MHKFILTLSVFLAAMANAGAVPKTMPLIIPSNTVSAVTSVAIGDAYNYNRDIDAVKLTVTGKTDTNIVLIATIGQPIAGYTNTVMTQTSASDAVTLTFPRNVLGTYGVECFKTDIATLSCRFAMATNTAVSATLTNAILVSATITTK